VTVGYALPTPTDWITCGWSCHRDRNPPSSEPGTDYGSGYGSAVYAADNGTITYVKTSNSQATGRVVEYRLDDGRTSRTLHMSQTWVYVGQRVSRGQQIGLSGASGYGDDWYYGPHAHQTLWPGAAWAAPTIDFAPYVGSNTPPPKPPEPPQEAFIMSTEVIVTVKNNSGGNIADKDRRAAFVNTESGFAVVFSWLAVADADKWAKQVGMTSALQFTDAGLNAFLDSLKEVAG
jgi:murein DD-endopeptidase MepM/ murein hydrolase activator NlpD